jgi:hypothetical protein
VRKTDEAYGPTVQAEISSMNEGDVLLLENVRFFLVFQHSFSFFNLIVNSSIPCRNVSNFLVCNEYKIIMLSLIIQQQMKLICPMVLQLEILIVHLDRLI